MPVQIRTAEQHMAMFSVDADAAQRMIDYSGLRVYRFRPRRAVIVLETNVPDDEEEYMIELINPVIVETAGEQTGAEGCLSIPNEFGVVTRPDYVKVRAQDRHGERIEVEGHGLTARAFCHEIDHLDGVLFIDKAIRMLSPEELEQQSKG